MSRALEAWLCNPFTGALVAEGEVPRRPHDPDVFVHAATVAPRGPQRQALVVGGAGFTPEAARGAALGEAIERFESWPRPSDGALARPPQGEPAWGPDDFVLFSAQQYAADGFPFAPPDEASLSPYVCARRIDDGHPVWIPQAFVYLDAPGGHHVAPMSSTGLSAGPPGHPTVLRGLQEVIERDALVRAWWGEYGIERWDPELVWEQLGPELAAIARRPNLRYAFHRIRTPYCAHACVVTLVGETLEGDCLSVGSACRATRRESLTKALLEAIQGRHYVRYRISQDDPWSEVPVSFEEHACWYSRWPERWADTAFARADAACDPDAAQRTDDLAALLGALGPDHPAVVRIVTPPIVARLAPGWRVLKVVVSGLVPLHGDHRMAHLGAARWRNRPFEQWLAYPPHPFA
ncbi:MAG: YcaO-like family protein [Myxococcota bacterium]